MATLSRALEAIERHIGFPQSRSAGIARRLQEATHLPMGKPFVAPELDERDVCKLIAVLASAPKLHEAVEHAEAYESMTPGGANLVDAPDSIPRSAIEYLEIQAEVTLRGGQEARDLVRGLRFEFTHEFREFSVFHPHDSVARFRAIGQDASRPAGHVRTAGVVRGDTFVNLFIDLFGATK